MNMFMSEQERFNFNNELNYAAKKNYKTQPLGGKKYISNNTTEAKVSDFELNHIFLINKRKHLLLFPIRFDKIHHLLKRIKF